MATASSVLTTMRTDITMILSFQIIIIILFGLFTRYDDAADPRSTTSHMLNVDYSMFQDIHVMIFVGFGFLMTFLKRYSYSAVAFNLLLAALVIQWAIICRGFFEMENGRIKISLKSLMGADIAAASVLISMGAVLGRTTFLQLIVMGVIEIAVFSANEYLMLEVLKITDVGGSIVVHTFGAYFGLAVSYMLKPGKTEEVSNSDLEGASYSSDVFAMIGTIFLWLFWPSFNGGLVTGDEKYRAIINTYLSLAACTVVAFAISSLTSREKKFDMVHIQNSTLAGGVAVGACCNLMMHPFAASVAGLVAAVISVMGYKYLTPKLITRFGLQDTCGVHNLHGMPGVFSGILAVIFSFLASESVYKDSLYNIFPAMNPSNEIGIGKARIAYENMTEIAVRSSGKQASYQLLAIIVTLAIAILSGGVTGFFLKSPVIGTLPDNKKYDDEFSWELPDHQHEVTINTTTERRQSTPNKQNNEENSQPKQEINMENV